MQNFSYAHKNTKGGERVSATAQFNQPHISGQIEKLRLSAFEREIPVSDNETLCFLQTLISAVQPKNILELGTAVGISGAVMLEVCKSARLTTIERDKNFYEEARTNFNNLGLTERVAQIFGDAGEAVLTLPENSFDFIFMDCAKVQYVKYLPVLKKLLDKGGVLLADDVLLYGWITGETPVPQKRKMLAAHVREYVDAVVGDKELNTTIINSGDGLALSVKI